MGLGACSSDRSLVGRTYDNVVARDNGYFLAREKLKVIEATLYKNRVNDYNRTLALFPVLDDATATKISADLDDIVKKASLPIQHRPGSDWTDDSYLVIGKARYYQRETEDAIKTFKYVNTTTRDLNVRHEALIWLMRSFMADKDYESALTVSNILEKEQGRVQNARDLFLVRAEYFLQTNEPQRAIGQLELAVPYIKEKNEKSRTRFVLAQLYQANGEDKKAYAELNQIIKHNPPYELEFYSKLMLGQVSDLATTDRARLDKYFNKLLKNPNNKEYRDKIYYEMARLDYRQQHYDKALVLLEKSARTPGTNRAQKGYTYLLTGRIYYENLQKYRLAAAYYDSTVQIMPKENPEHLAIAERAAVLKDFAQQIAVVETQDSLQTLARLDPATLQSRLVGYAVSELAARKKEEERLLALQEKQARQQEGITGVSSLRAGDPNIDPNTFAMTGTGAQWYFDNSTSLSTARSEFIRRWGDRPLQDSWRNISQASNSPVTTRGGNVPVSLTDAANNVNPGSEATLPPAADPAAQQAALVEQYRKSIPFTPAQMQLSQVQVEEALFALGTIYSQQLREPTRAATTYEQLLTRFPRTKHAPETYYSLYLIYKEQPDVPKSESYAQRLRQEYANSSFARLVADPEYLRRASVANAKVAVELDTAFALYKRQEFSKATAVLAQTRQRYPDNDYNDRMAFLNTLLTIRTQTPATAKASVEKFYKDYPESPLSGQALTLLNSYKEYEAGKISGALASTAKPGVSAFRPGEVETRRRLPVTDVRVAATPARPAVEATGVRRPAATADPTPDPAATAPTATPPTAPTATPPNTTVAATLPAITTPAPGAPTPAPARPNATTTATSPAGVTTTAATPAPDAPAKPATAYQPVLNTPHAVVLAFPRGNLPLKDMPALLTTYNSRFFRVNNLQVQESALNEELELVVIQALPDARVAQSYALKLRGPQSPLSRLRGAGYQTLVIGTENLPLLLQSKDVAEYQRFYQQTYTK